VVNGALGRWGVGAKAKMLQLNGIYFPFYWRVKNFHPHVLAPLVTYCIIRGYLSHHQRAEFNFREVGRTLYRGFWGILLPVIILGGIYGGIFTVTEAAAVAVVYTLLVELFIHRELKLKKIPRLFSQSAVEMGTIIIIVVSQSVSPGF